MKIRKTVGIDLGTTNSVIALLDATDSTLIAGQDELARKTSRRSLATGARRAGPPLAMLRPL